MPEIIDIPEIKGNFYGGKPYNVGLNLGYAQSPSTLTINVINQSGIYNKPKLSYKNIITLTLGDITFKGYLVSYKNNKTVAQKDLELTYKDCSRLLDIHYVGLHKRHGINLDAKFNFNGKILKNSKLDTQAQQALSALSGKSKIEHLIIVGEELHPCDINRDGSITPQDGNSLIDWCDPCPFCPENKYEERCEGLNDLKVLDVGYTFKELLDKIKVSAPLIVTNSVKVYRQYAGTLRSVLQSWCQEYGLTFYWDYSASTISDGIKLIDRSVPISINYTPDECDATEIYEGESIENTFTTNTISYYQRDGEIKQYSCEDIGYSTLSPITFADFINDENYESPEQFIRWKELAICLSYYSDSLRDCLYWFNYYKITNKDNAKLYEFTSKDLNSTKALEQDRGKILSPFGNMKIRKVISKDVNAALFQDCVNLMGDQIQEYNDYSTKLGRDPQDDPAYYFFVAQVDKELQAKLFSVDNEYATSFLGKYWIKLTNALTCGGAGANPRYAKVNVSAPDGQAEWYSQSADSVYLPFTNYGHQKNSKIDFFINEASSKQNETSLQSANLGNGVTREYNAAYSFILMERDAKWYPNAAELNNYSDIIAYYQSLIFQYVDVNTNGQPPLLKTINPEYANRKDIFLFIVKEIEGSELPITVTEIENFLEPNQMKNIYADDAENSVCTYVGDNSPVGQRVIGQYGLKKNKTAWVTFDGFQFMVPVGGTDLIQQAAPNKWSTTPNDDDGTYRVMITQSSQIPSCIPKIQNSLISWESPADVGVVEVNFNDVSDEDIDLFESQSCVPSNSTLQKIHQTKNVMASISNNKAEKLLEYQIVGAPKNTPKVSDGLDSISIRVTDNGIFTNYSLSDKLRLAPNPEILIRNATYNKQTAPKAIGEYPVRFPYNT